MSNGQVKERVSGTELRQARFPQALRGYDRGAVDAFLRDVADWVEGEPGVSDASPQLTSEFAKVGERTAGILTAAEEAAAKLRRDAKEYAVKLRSAAEEESRKARLQASQKADELIGEAEAKAERIIDEAIARRRQLNQAVSSLVDRRDEIAVEAQRLADELLAAVDALQSEEEAEAEQAPGPPGEDEPTELEPPDQRETTIQEVT